ncbi:MAG: zinc-ribbon domain-containing protein [Longimicrobiaceae bacterium]
MAETCPACGAEASGRFCNQCGAAIAAACSECGNPLPRGARFCNQCGAPAAATPAAAAPRASLLPWVVAGAALLGLVAVLLVPRFRGAPQPAGQTVAPPPFAAATQPGAAPSSAVPGGGNPGAVDLSQMTPREAADRLFNRVMTAAATGDSAQAQRFVPMAVMAYQRVDSLDADGRYHLAALHLVGRDWAAARAQADTLLAASPTHLMGLFSAAEAEHGRGNTAAAKDFYRRFVRAYDAEVAKRLPEYEEHSQGLPAMRAQAVARLDQQ